MKDNNKKLIISDGCCVQYDDTLALDDVTFSVTEGKLVAVVGPNGGGKSTLFKAITGLIPLANGSLQIDGMEPNTAKSIISYIPQKAEINWNFSLTVKQVVEMGLTSRNSIGYFSKKNYSDAINESLDKVGLLDKLNENINNLSGGQQQRVFLARALTQEAKILLLDEAFSAVDIGAQDDIFNLIKDIRSEGKTILVATHDVYNIQETYDEVLCLNRHCCAFGVPSEVLTDDVIEEMYGSHTALFRNHTIDNHGSHNG